MGKQKQQSSISLLLFALVALFLFISPYYKGIFNGHIISFEGAVYGSLVFGAVLLAVVGIFSFQNFRVNSLHGLLILIAFLLPVAYLISSFVAVSEHAATNSIYIHIAYAAFFTASLYICISVQLRGYLLYSLLCASYFIVIFGFMNWFGDASLWGIIDYSGMDTYKDAVMLTEIGHRLTSVFQYANTYAGLLIGLYLASLLLLLHKRKWSISMVPALLLVPILTSLFLTLSRAGFLILPVVALIVLPLLHVHRQILFILHSILVAIVSLILLPIITPLGIALQTSQDASAVLKGWTTIIISSLVYGVAAFCIQKYLEPWLSKKLQFLQSKMLYYRFLLPLLLVVFISIAAIIVISDSAILSILPQALQERLSNINLQQHSLLERLTFYQDSLKIIMDYPLLGTGGGGWTSLYHQYQNNPYVSSQAHNFVLQVLIEVGLLGFIVFAALLLGIAYLFLRTLYRSDSSDPSALSFFGLFLGLLVHSLIDFDMSFLYIGALFFISLGALAATVENKPISIFKEIYVSRISKGFATLIVVLALFVFFVSLQKSSAHPLFMKARADAESGGAFPQIEQNLNLAISKHPNHPVYLAQKADFYIQVYEQTGRTEYFDEAKTLINKVREGEPRLYDGYSLQSKALMLDNATDAQLLELAESYLVMYPWNMSLYEQVIVLHNQLYVQYYNEGNSASATIHKEQILQHYETIREKMAHLETLPEGQGQGKAFEPTSVITDIIQSFE